MKDKREQRVVRDKPPIVMALRLCGSLMFALACTGANIESDASMDTRRSDGNGFDAQRDTNVGDVGPDSVDIQDSSPPLDSPLRDSPPLDSPPPDPDSGGLPDATALDVPVLDGGLGCTFPDPDQRERVDFAGFDIRSLNQGSNASFLRTVFDLSPARLSAVAAGARLAFDVRNGPFDFMFRAELREKNIMTSPEPGTTQVYRQRFDVEVLPDLEGPTTIFQRFNRDVDGPDIEVELTGARQFGDAVANEIQVVAFGDRRRIRGRQLADENELLVLIYNHASNGFYRVSLNGETLAEARNIRTVASTRGSWHQFGLYPHGLQDDANRRRQRDGGAFEFALVYHWATKWAYDGEVDPAQFGTVDPATGRCGL